MRIIDELKRIVLDLPAGINEKKGIYSFEVLVAERKALLSRKRLMYAARFQVNEGHKVVVFSDKLKESGSGLSSGGFDGDMGSGFGFKKESYNTLPKSKEGTIEEQSRLFRKKYEYAFDFGAIRSKFEEKATESGYGFTCKII